jgi:hypothetical protein
MAARIRPESAVQALNANTGVAPSSRHFLTQAVPFGPMSPFFTFAAAHPLSENQPVQVTVFPDFDGEAANVVDAASTTAAAKTDVRII